MDKFFQSYWRVGHRISKKCTNVLTETFSSNGITDTINFFHVSLFFFFSFYNPQYYNQIMKTYKTKEKIKKGFGIFSVSSQM